MAKEVIQQILLPKEQATGSIGSIECLGLTFESNESRRIYFLEKLRAGLDELHTGLGGVPFTSVDDAVQRMKAIQKWPMGDESRRREMAERMRQAGSDKDLLQRWKDEVGFPHGEIEDILGISDPPYFTACPNPFISAFIQHHSKPYDPNEPYRREPLAIDVSEGKTDPIYTAHSYHTKVPHKAIIRAILHYAEPGDVVLDGFAGSGMTGVAAQICANPDAEFKLAVEAERAAAGLTPPHWGPRRVVLNDLGPAATFIAANYNLPFDVEAFEREARRILTELRQDIGWMYETLHTDGKTMGRINYTVWSEVFACPDCGEEIVFLKEALEPDSKRVRDLFPCPGCSAQLTKNNLERLMETLADPATGEIWRHVRFIPVLIHYTVGDVKYEKEPNANDLAVLNKISHLPLTASVPTNAFPIADMSHGSRLSPKGFNRVHHLYLPRPAQALGRLWAKAAAAVEDGRLRNMLLFWVEQAFWTASLLNRYRPTGYSQVNQYLTGVYYVASQHAECSPWYILEGKLGRLVKAFHKTEVTSADGNACTSTGTAAMLPISEDSIDYIFTDPPFGENIYYADLNFLVESWHHAWTNARPEAIVDKAKGKGMPEYQHLMRRCFSEYYRVLKPGRWMTVVFHNSHNAVWNAIMNALGEEGFVIADMRELDKGQRSYRQVTSQAMQKDLVISAYKPNGGLEKRFESVGGTEEGVWDFVRTHLRTLPPFMERGDALELLVSRTGQGLWDAAVTFHVAHGVMLPLSAAEFYAGLRVRFPERDSMFFLPDQVTEYDRKRLTKKEILQLEFVPSDERTSVDWIRQQLEKKPQTYQELMPQFLRAIGGGWSKHEKPLELSELLEQNFLRYDGIGPIPTQIWSWMQKSGTMRERMKDKDRETADPRLQADAKDRWYVPDPNQAQDLEKLRERTLLKEFEEYRAFTGRKLKDFRSEAVRAGFKKAWTERDYQTILDVAGKIPEQILQEDSKLLMWYYQALTRMGGGA